MTFLVYNTVKIILVLCLCSEFEDALAFASFILPMARLEQRLTIQAQDAKFLFEAISDHLDWSDLSKDTVMDIGVGRERNSSSLLVTLHPHVKKCVAIDENAEVIRKAREVTHHPKLQFEEANILTRFTTRRWEGKMSKIISVNCFNCLRNEQTAFMNTYRLLKPSGEMAVVFNLRSGYFDWFIDLVQQQKWKPFYDGIGPFIPDSHLNNLNAEHYRALFTEIGFRILQCEEKERRYAYVSDDDCTDAAIGTCSFLKNIPTSLVKEFREDALQIFLKHNGRIANGEPCLIYHSLTVVARKPK